MTGFFDEVRRARAEAEEARLIAAIREFGRQLRGEVPSRNEYAEAQALLDEPPPRPPRKRRRHVLPFRRKD